jgi:hypothetical protein
VSRQYSLCRSVGSGIPFILGDGADAVTVLLQPMRLVDWGVLEQKLLFERKRALDLDNLDTETAALLKDTLKADRSIDLGDLFSYADTRPGATWRLWLSLRLQYPYWQCVEWIDTLVGQKRFEEYVGAATQIDGIDLYAGFDWPKLRAQEFVSKVRKTQDQDLDWRLHVHVAAEAHNISPREFGELTIYEARLLLCDRETLEGKVKLTPEEHKMYINVRQAEKYYETQQAERRNVGLPLKG